jgi:hypothetical protein
LQRVNEELITITFASATRSVENLNLIGGKNSQGEWLSL